MDTERRAETLKWEHKKWIVKPVMSGLVSFLIASLFFMVLDGYLIFKLLGLGSYAEWVLLKSRWLIIGGLLIQAGLFVLFAVVVALKVADSIISPIERVERDADLLFNAPHSRYYEIRVREGDPLKTLIDKINRFVSKVRNKNGAIN